MNCIWKDKVNCNELMCNLDCDWKELEFTKEAIEKRISQEKKKLRLLYFTARKRKEKEIEDKAKGIFIMYDILEKDFNVENMIKKEMSFLLKNA